MITTMRALVTNDDGIEAPGLAVLAMAALEAGYDVTVAAPHEEQSGASAATQAREDQGHVRVHPAELAGLRAGSAVAVEATPAYIVWLAVHGGFGDRPDLVLSGVNIGANVGHSVLHSGTVGAALGAVLQGTPGVAFSLDAYRDPVWDTASDVCRDVLRWTASRRFDASVCLNVNIPNVSAADVRGVVETPLARLGAFQARAVETGEGTVRMRVEQLDLRDEPDSDAARVRDGFVTVTGLVGPRAAAGVDLTGLVEAGSATPLLQR
jgi:5'-nucleotidase